MSDPSDLLIQDDEEDNGEFILDESDIIYEVASCYEEDSVYIFTGHSKRELYSVACSPSDMDSCTEREVYSAACSPSNMALVATGGSDDKGFLCRIGEGDWTCQLNGHTDSVSSLEFSYDGTFLASRGLDGIVKVWDASGNLKGSLEGHAGGIEGTQYVLVMTMEP